MMEVKGVCRPVYGARGEGVVSRSAAMAYLADVNLNLIYDGGHS